MVILIITVVLLYECVITWAPKVYPAIIFQALLIQPHTDLLIIIDRPSSRYLSRSGLVWKTACGLRSVISRSTISFSSKARFPLPKDGMPFASPSQWGGAPKGRWGTLSSRTLSCNRQIALFPVFTPKQGNMLNNGNTETGRACIEYPSQSQPHPVSNRHLPPADEAPVDHQAVFPGSYG